MSDLKQTEEWFRRAIPTPNLRTFDVQMAVHFEEVAEMILSMGSNQSSTLQLLDGIGSKLQFLSSQLKAGRATVLIRDRKEFLDGCVDQVVTATGAAYMAGMQPAEALNRVNESNWSKFKDGQPIFDANGKIAKNPETYKKPDLEGLY